MKNVIIALILLIISANACAETVVEVYSCGNDVGIKTSTNGWLVARAVDLGVERVNRILAISLALLSTQNPMGYYDMAAPVMWCGISSVKPITVLAIQAN